MLILLTTVLVAAAATVAALAIFTGDDEPATPVDARVVPTPTTPNLPPASTTTAPATTNTTTTATSKARAKRDAAAPPRGVTPGRMIGQKIMVGFRGQASPPPALLSAIRRGRVGGVILFTENNGAGAGFGAVAEQLQRAAAAGDSPPLLISTDQEGGLVRRISDAPPSIAPREMGAAGAAVSRQQGLLAGQALRRRGINVNLAPVVDVPDSPRTTFLGTRVFGTSPQAVGTTAGAFASGLQEGGVAATAKHYPGLGTTGMRNTDEQIVQVDTPLAELTRRAQPFRRLVESGVRLVMVSNAIYTALDADDPAVLSRRIVTARLRSFFDGVIISDALEAPAVRRYGPELPLRATNAGVDILLYSDANASGAFDQMRSAYRAGTLSPRRLRSSYDRIMALKRWVADGR